MTKKNTPKKKEPSIKSLRNKLWKACSEFIRYRDKGICFTCNKSVSGKGYHSGHFIPSKICNLDLRYDPKNLRGQCFFCNLMLGGNGAVFYRRMVEDFGQKYVDELFEQMNKKIEWTTEDYRAKTLFYERALKMLKSI